MLPLPTYWSFCNKKIAKYKQKIIYLKDAYLCNMSIFFYFAHRRFYRTLYNSFALLQNMLHLNISTQRQPGAIYYW
jgi:hypothetical protein